METYHYMLYRINFQKGSYPTYEEWKPIDKIHVEYIFHQVLILPMRNGNEILGFKVTENTRSYPTYEEIIKNETRV